MSAGALKPGTALFFGGTEDTFGALHGLHVEISDIGVAVGAISGTTRQTKTDLEVVVQHHFVLPEAALAIEDAENTLLGFHAAVGASPGLGVVATVVSSAGSDGTRTFARDVGGGLSDGISIANDGAGRSSSSLGGFESATTRAPAGGIMRVVIVVRVIIIVLLHGASRVKQLMLLHRLLHLLIRGNLSQVRLVDSLGGFLLLNHPEDTVVQMLVEVLRIAECSRASGTLAGSIAAIVGSLLGGG